MKKLTKMKEIILLFINKEIDENKKEIFHIWKYTIKDPSLMIGIELLDYSKYKFS